MTTPDAPGRADTDLAQDPARVKSPSAGKTMIALQDKLAEIADKCPVHRTLEAKSAIVMSIETAI
jgi:hypothetical protein